MICITSVSASRERALSNGVAQQGFDTGRRFGPQPSNRSARRRYGHALNRALGLSDHVGILVHHGAARTAARRRQGSRRSGARRRPGLFTRRCHHSFDPCWLIARPGSSRAACQCRPHQVARSSTSPSRRSAGSPSRRGVSGRRGLARAHSAPSVPRSVRGERRRVSRATVTGSRNGAQARRRAAWRVIRRSRLSRAFREERAHANGRPTTVWSRRARCPVRSCRRGARLKPSVERNR